jgi:hypothetical protein
MWITVASTLFAGVIKEVPTSAGWKKYSANPIIGGVLGTVFDVSVLKE